MTGALPLQAPFRDETKEINAIVKAYFSARSQTVYTGEETPADNLERYLPFVRIGRVGGATRSGAEHTDRPVIDIDVLASTRDDAKRIAQEIEQLLMSRPHPIDHCNVLMGPQRVPWVEGVPIRRFYASYHIGMRR